MTKNRILILLLCLSFSFGFSQKSSKTFGLQFKPILPLKVLNVTDLKLDEDNFKVTISPLLGYNFGGVIRFGFNDKLALETGLNYNRRNFKLDAQLDDSLSGSLEYGVVTYEIPIQGLFYVRLSKKWYMNAATGISLNFRASDVGKFTANYEFIQSTRVQNINLAYVANVGVEYRTKKNGTFYMGGSLTTPFRPLGVVRVTSQDEFNVRQISGFLSGNYISVDIRYFFQDSKKNKTAVE